MKKKIIDYFKKTKKIIVSLIISTVLLVFNYVSMFVFFMNKQEAILAFNQSKNINKEILPFTLMTIFSGILLIIISLLVVILIVKALFPNTKAFSSLMMKEEADFLFSLPKRFREGSENR